MSAFDAGETGHASVDAEMDPAAVRKSLHGINTGGTMAANNITNRLFPQTD